MSVPEIFDRAARRLRRARSPAGERYLESVMAEDLLDRLDLVKRKFSRARLIGHNSAVADVLHARGIELDIVDPAPARVLSAGRVCDEDALALDGRPYDLVVAAGTLDTVADLPGALILIRRSLVPDGLFLGSMFGAPSLPALRRAVVHADEVFGQAVQRFHPLVDARAAGDLLVRAGFALPVADAETLSLTYTSVDRLISDLRAAAATNVLIDRYPVSRLWYAALASAFVKQGEDGRVAEAITLVMLTGWAPAPNQPQPAKRGSGRTSLAAALKPLGSNPTPE